jgi:uncharacterized membrane protein
MWWANLRSSLWFVPSLVVLAAGGLAVLLIELQPLVGIDLALRWPRLFGAGAEGARGMLTAIASSMITVAGVVFSVTIVVLSLAASQYTSRLLRNFMGSRANQTVLGVFLGIFVYCVIVLRTIRGGDDEFVPSLAVLGAVLLSLVGIGFLVYFIHHLASMIQVTHILDSVREETLAAGRHLFPEADELHDLEDEPGAPPARDTGGAGKVITATRTGFIQAVDLDRLARTAERRRWTVAMLRGVGEFVIRDEGLARVTGSEGTVDEQAVRRAWHVNRTRTVEQDPGFGIRQIVDVALKALSPAINDPTTAIYCLDNLAAIFVALGNRRIAPTHRLHEGRALVLVCGPSYGTLVDEAFGEIGHAARDWPRVLQHLRDICARLAEQTPSAARRQLLRRQVELAAARLVE